MEVILEMREEQEWVWVAVDDETVADGKYDVERDMEGARGSVRWRLCLCVTWWLVVVGWCL